MGLPFFTDLDKADRYGRHGDRCVSEDHCGNLISAAADAAGTYQHRLRHEIADAESKVADGQVRKDLERGVSDEADNRSWDSERERADKGRVAIPGCTIAELVGATGAYRVSVDAVGGPTQRLLAYSAARRSRSVGVLGSVELRSGVAQIGVLHGAGAYHGCGAAQRW